MSDAEGYACRAVRFKRAYRSIESTNAHKINPVKTTNSVLVVSLYFRKKTLSNVKPSTVSQTNVKSVPVVNVIARLTKSDINLC